MKNSTVYILLFFLLVGSTAGAQSLPLTNDAAKKCQAKDFAGAQAAIAQALSSDAEKDDPYTWYVNGFIYKEIYKANEQGQIKSASRTKAVEAFEHSLAIDKANKHSAMTKSAMKFLATSYYNDALIHSKEVDLENEAECFELFTTFKRLIKIVDPSTNINPFEIEIKKSLGQRHYALWEGDTDNAEEAAAAIACFGDVLRMDSTDCDANYNMAIVHYNQAVFKIRKIDSSTDIMTLIFIQDECVQLFKKSLPYMERAYQQCPPKADYFKGMMFINRALGRDQEYEKYRIALEDAINSGQLKPRE